MEGTGGGSWLPLQPTPAGDRWKARTFLCLGLVSMMLLVGLAMREFRPQSNRAGYDEAEHIHVVYALDRGETPYRDFFENHPVLPTSFCSTRPERWASWTTRPPCSGLFPSRRPWN